MMHTALVHNLNTIKDLTPTLLWRWFAHIASIPHPSYHEEALATFIVNWAKEQNLTVWRDGVGNVIIKKPATQGMEHRTPIVLQAHLDMVPQANADTPHDFTKDPLLLRISDDGKWLLATNTTLGADNGIGMASCLALLESDLPHPDLEVLLTMTEETGMDGAFGLDADTLTAPIMINTDTEEIGEIYVGCAGGVNADVVLPLQYTDNVYDSALQINLKGLKGGHSGIDIHKNRGNAIKLIARILARLHATQADKFALSQVCGGTLRNAIAREAHAVIVCHFDDKDKIIKDLTQAIKDLTHEINNAEPTLVMDIYPTDVPSQTLTYESTAKAIHLINALPSGVVRYSDVVADTVETSLSFGVLAMDECIKATLLVRSLTQTGKKACCDVVASVAHLAGANVAFTGDYVGWNYDPNSVITPIAKDLYTKILGKEPAIKVIHAGLECGLIKKNYPNMDIVSIGPTIKNAHSPDEKVDIDSVVVYWELLTQLLANSPLK